MKYFLLLLSVFMYQASNFAQSAQTDIQLYHCMMHLNDEYAQYMKANDIKPAPLIDGRYIDPGTQDVYNEQSFKKGIEENFPDPNGTGLGIIDWETKTYNDLCNKPASDPELQRAMQVFIRMVDVAKKLRPNVKWGIYNIPYYTYWQRDNRLWLEQGRILKPLLEKVDILMISLYDFYKDGSPATDDAAYIKENMNVALQIAQHIDKPLYVFIWDRYHDSNETIGLELIPQHEFADHLDDILTATYGTKKVDGIVWFDAQDWFYSQKKSLAVSDASLLRTSPEKAKSEVIRHYGEIIRDRVDEQNFKNKKDK